MLASSRRRFTSTQNSLFSSPVLPPFSLVISLESIRRFQRDLDQRLRARNVVVQDEEYVLPEETEENLLLNGGGKGYLKRKLKGRTMVVVLEQVSRGLVHTIQFSVSYCIMLLFMYSNGRYFICSQRQYQNTILMIYRLHYHLNFVWSTGGLCALHQGHP
jgi:hypothetical protein